tara:strand:- start:123 stop:515 length:393 start_codon:yes stop_codon:yes gene_type:complete
MYYLEVISLEKCPYSLAAEKLLKSKDVNFDLVKVNYSDKETYKTEKISTFPQIYLKKHGSSGRLLVGGFNDLEKINNMVVSLIDSKDKTFEKVNTNKFSPLNYLTKEISDIVSNENFNRKSILRLIEILV